MCTGRLLKIPKMWLKLNLVTKNNNTEHTEGGHASDLIRKNCFFSSEEFKFKSFAIDNLDF